MRHRIVLMGGIIGILTVLSTISYFQNREVQKLSEAIAVEQKTLLSLGHVHQAVVEYKTAKKLHDDWSAAIYTLMTDNAHSVDLMSLLQYMSGRFDLEAFNLKHGQLFVQAIAKQPENIPMLMRQITAVQCSGKVLQYQVIGPKIITKVQC